MSNLLDQQLGNYRLIRLLGQGGFADVYLGEHLLLGTQAAIKVHHARMEGNDLERFEQEARTIAWLNHPHIVRVLDYGVQDGVAYLVMNYASHGTLRQRHSPGTMVALPTVVPYVKQIASVLSIAWAAGTYNPAYIVSGDRNGQIRVWNPDDGTTRLTVSQAAPVTDLAASSYEFIAAGTQPGGTHSLWDSRSGGAAQFTNDNQSGVNTPYDSLTMQLTPGTLTAVAWSEDGSFAAIGDAHGNIHFISDVSCSCFLHMSEFRAHTQQINAISWASTGLKFATASNDGTVQTWNVALENQSSAWTTVKAQHVHTFRSSAQVLTIAWSPDGQHLLYGDSVGNVGFWTVQ